MNSLFLTALCVATLSSGLVSGLFLTFSDFLMRCFGKTKQASSGLEVMQIINREIWRSIVMVLLWGTLGITLALCAFALTKAAGPVAWWVGAGTGLYLFGVLVVTYLFNIPMNDRLEALDASEAQAQSYWVESYLPRWTKWNALRALASFGCSLCFLIATLLAVGAST